MSAPRPTEPRAAPIRRILFETDTIEPGAFSARPLSDACGDVERQDRDVVTGGASQWPVFRVFRRADDRGQGLRSPPTP
jgi:hypothetical protein